MTLIIRRF